VINEEAMPYGRAGVNLDPSQKADDLRIESRQEAQVMEPHPMQDPMGPQSMQSWIAEQNFQIRAGGWVAFENRSYIFPHGLEEADHQY
jgi:hypothetical protein